MNVRNSNWLEIIFEEKIFKKKQGTYTETLDAFNEIIFKTNYNLLKKDA